MNKKWLIKTRDLTVLRARVPRSRRTNFQKQRPRDLSTPFNYYLFLARRAIYIITFFIVLVSLTAIERFFLWSKPVLVGKSTPLNTSFTPLVAWFATSRESDSVFACFMSIGLGVFSWTNRTRLFNAFVFLITHVETVFFVMFFRENLNNYQILRAIAQLIIHIRQTTFVRSSEARFSF